MRLGEDLRVLAGALYISRCLSMEGSSMTVLFGHFDGSNRVAMLSSEIQVKLGPAEDSLVPGGHP